LQDPQLRSLGELAFQVRSRLRGRRPRTRGPPRQSQVLLVGVDYLSVEPFDAPRPHPVHVTLLEARIVVVEGLDLGRVEPGEYELFCLPLKLVGSDGAPARTVLVRRSTR